MFRCVTLAVSALALAGPAAAQIPRNFPSDALRGILYTEQPPAVLINGRSARLSPGARIRGESNLMMVSGGLAGRKLLVHYTLDLSGELKDVWILSAAEAARRPWPTTPAEAAAWRFDPANQTWSRP